MSHYVNLNPTKKHLTNSKGICKITRIKTYPVDLIFDFIKNNPLIKEVKNWDYNKDPKAFYIDEEGYKCKLRRARIFFEIGIDCKSCPVKDQFFALEKWTDGSYHFDLYGIDEAGDEVLMTIDHIHAKSNGGKNHITNYAPLCKVCNEIKSNK